MRVCEDDQGPWGWLLSHEQSETVQLPDGTWVNVYGKNTPKAGQRLDQLSFTDLQAAINAAKSRSDSYGDPELARVAYEVMAMQAADRQRGKPPRVMSEKGMRKYMDRPLPEAQFDGQLTYETGLPKEPPSEPLPGATGPNQDPNFRDRLFGVLNKMGLTGTQIKNFFARTEASLPGPRLSNREVIATEVDPVFSNSTFDDKRSHSLHSRPTTYERGVGFSNEPKSPIPHPADVGAGFGPGILAGPKGAQRLILAGRRSPELWENLEEAKKAIHTPASSQEIWEKYGWEMGPDRRWRFEIPMQNVEEAAKPRSNAGSFTSEAGTFPTKNYEITLGKLLADNPDLLTAYPSLARIPVSWKSISGGLYSGGRWIAPTPIAKLMGKERIELAKEAEPKKLLTNFAHEVQHPVQVREGFLRRPTGLATAIEVLDPQKARALEFSDRYAELRVLMEELFGPEVTRHPGYMSYFRQSTEAEARNSARRDINPALRKQTPSATEDIPRDLQDTTSAFPWKKGEAENTKQILDAAKAEQKAQRRAAMLKSGEIDFAWNYGDDGLLKGVTMSQGDKKTTLELLRDQNSRVTKMKVTE